VPSSKDWRKVARNHAGHQSPRNKGASISMEDGQPWGEPLQDWPRSPPTTGKSATNAAMVEASSYPRRLLQAGCLEKRARHGHQDEIRQGGKLLELGRRNGAPRG
jgi:hypothetical protein